VVFELLRGPDNLDFISYIVTASVADAKLGFLGVAASATNVRGASGFRSQAVLFDHIATGPAAKTACGSSARTCATTTLATSSGSVIVSCAASVANGRTGDARAAVTMAKAAVAYLVTIDPSLASRGKAGGRRHAAVAIDSTNPDWSPNGLRIAFDNLADPNATNDEIWVMNADGSNQRQLTRTPGFNEDPRWSP
jgi:hypothetical protein